MEHKNKDVVAQCYVLYGGYVKHIISRYYADNDDIDDIFQEVFLNLIRAKFSGDPFSFKTKMYIGKAAKNACISRIRKDIAREKNKETLIQREMALSAEIQMGDIGDIVIEGMVVNTLYDVINELHDEEQNLIFDRYYHQKKYTRIASDHGVSYYFIKKRMLKIKKILRRKLQHTL